jgi:hypothetical protein
MELEKSQEKRIDGIDFKKEIKKEVEDCFIKRYQKLGKDISGLTENFSIDIKTLKTLVSNNKSKPYCKFYYLQKDDSFTIGISFSDNDECIIKKNEDKLYDLSGDIIKDEHFIKMKQNFEVGIGLKLSPHTNKIQDVLTYYTLQDIETFINVMGKSRPIYRLKFNMLHYRSTGIDNEVLADFAERNNRISFCVHAVYNTEHLYEESAGYNLGNLRP